MSEQQRMLKKNILLGVPLILALVVAVFFSFEQPASEMRIPYEDSAAVALGAQIYKRECSECHGADLSGESHWRKRDEQGYLPAPPHDESGHSWHHPDQLLFVLVKDGVQAVAGTDYQTRMPAFKDKLSDEQIWAVLANIKSRWPDEVIARHNEMFVDH